MRPTLIAVLSLACPLAAQSTWYVDVNGSAPGSGTVLDPYTSIDFALDQPSTQSGDLVLVLPGTYVENVSFDGKGVVLMSTNGAGSTVIDAGGAGSAVSFLGTDGSTMVLDGFRVTGGGGSDVHGVLRGGGILGRDALVSIRQCGVTGNTATEGGGLYLDNCVANIQRCRISANLTTWGNGVAAGGGLYALDGSTFVLRVAIAGNDAGTPNNPGSGGGVYVDGSNDMTLRGCKLKDNVGEISGGGLRGSALIDRCRIEDNLSQFGGGLYGGSVVTDSLLAGNRADSATGTSHFGGGAYDGTFSQCTFDGNTAFGEGAAANGATLLVCEVRDNASFVAFGPFATGALDGCLAIATSVVNNRVDGDTFAPAQGGGAANSDLIDCDVDSNQANAPVLAYTTAAGGGVFGGTLDGCRVVDNFCAANGGGVAYADVTGSEIVGNSAQQGAGCFDSNLDRTTVFGNTSLSAGPGGMYVEGSGSVRDSILWNNGLELFAGPGATLTVTYSDVEGGWPGTGNLALDPLFWDPALPDLHLTAGSPCIDAGDPLSSPDPDGSRADMGAWPFDPSYTGS